MRDFAVRQARPGFHRGLRLPSAGIMVAAALAALSVLSRESIARSAPQQPVELVAVGDICLAGSVERSSHRREATYPFTAVVDSLRKADIAFGNLECCLSSRGTRVPKRYNFRASPSWAPRLSRVGFDVLSLANNHSLDYHRVALEDTVNALRAAGIHPVGGGLNQTDAHAMRVVTIRGVRVGFLAYLGMFPPLLPVLPDQPGVAMGYPEVVRRRVAAERRKVDFLVVSLHAGVEMSRRPSSRQRSIARAAVDAGADIVLGHHPHIVQPVERYRRSVICYSLGNFVFSPSRAVLRQPDGPWGAMAVIHVEQGKAVKARLLPLRIADAQPRIPGRRAPRQTSMTP